MPTPSLDPIDAFTYLTSLTVSLGMLYSLLFLLVPQCSALIIASGAREACTMGVGVLAGAVLVVLVVYCGYQLCRMLFPARVG
jgi:hypothetical protein